MRKLAATLIVAGILALFHIVVVAAPLISSHGVGEQNMLGVLLDFPLVIFWSALGTAFHCDIWGHRDLSIFFISFGGTMMYAAVGAYIGCGIDFIREVIRHRLTTRSSERVGR